MPEPILRLQGVHTYIDRHHILQGVDMDVPAGHAMVLLGRNGAGKSTTMRTVMGLNPARKGSISFDGRPIEASRPYEIARMGVGFVPEDQAVLYTLSVEDNFRLAMLQEDQESYQRLEEVFGLFPDMKKFWKQKAGVLSGGQKQMLAIARTMVNDHKLLLIDEPSKGLAPILVDQLAETLNQIKHQTTVVLVEQNFHMASRVGSLFYLLDDGRVVHHGAMEDLMGDHEMKHKYLGIA